MKDVARQRGSVNASPRFTEEWFAEGSCIALGRLAASTHNLSGDVVEVGSWQGRSTLALAQAVAPTAVHAVDTWRGSLGEVSEVLAGQRDVFAEFLVNTADTPNITPHRQDWRDYFTEHPAPIRLGFIDALHTYEEVRDQLATMRPLVVPGGLLCGDDNHHPPIQQAVLDAFGTAYITATLWWVAL